MDRRNFLAGLTAAFTVPTIGLANIPLTTEHILQNVQLQSGIKVLLFAKPIVDRSQDAAPLTNYTYVDWTPNLPKYIKDNPPLQLQKLPINVSYANDYFMVGDDPYTTAMRMMITLNEGEAIGEIHGAIVIPGIANADIWNSMMFVISLGKPVMKHEHNRIALNISVDRLFYANPPTAESLYIPTT